MLLPIKSPVDFEGVDIDGEFEVHRYKWTDSSFNYFDGGLFDLITDEEGQRIDALRKHFWKLKEEALISILKRVRGENLVDAISEIVLAKLTRGEIELALKADGAGRQRHQSIARGGLTGLMYLGASLESYDQLVNLRQVGPTTEELRQHHSFFGLVAMDERRYTDGLSEVHALSVELNDSLNHSVESSMQRLFHPVLNEPKTANRKELYLGLSEPIVEGGRKHFREGAESDECYTFKVIGDKEVEITFDGCTRRFHYSLGMRCLKEVFLKTRKTEDENIGSATSTVFIPVYELFGVVSAREGNSIRRMDDSQGASYSQGKPQLSVSKKIGLEKRKKELVNDLEDLEHLQCLGGALSERESEIATELSEIEEQLNSMVPDKSIEALQKNLRDALKAIEKKLPPLRSHLLECYKYRGGCEYSPPRGVVWNVITEK